MTRSSLSKAELAEILQRIEEAMKSMSEAQTSLRTSVWIMTSEDEDTENHEKVE